MAFTIDYHRAGDDPQLRRAAIDCAGQGIATIKAEVFGPDGAFLKSGGPWACDVGSGTITSIDAGSGRTVVILGNSDDGVVILSGRKSGIDVLADTSVNAGTIDCYDFVPSPQTPTNRLVANADAIQFKWNALAGANQYRLVISEHSDLSDPVIDERTVEANFTPQALSNLKTYYWQVYAFDSQDHTGRGSTIWSFSTNTAAGRLPDTGQVQSYTDTFGEDSDYTINPPAYTKLDASGNALAADAADWAMVKDDVTGLIWDVTTKDHWCLGQNAQQEIDDSLNKDNFGGYSDWRLPTIKELFTLVKNIQTADDSEMKINTSFFPDVYGCFWSSTAVTDSNACANCFSDICFRNGLFWHLPVSESNRAMAVRGETKNADLVDNGDGTVTDMATGLMWQQGETEDGKMTWEQALDHCEALELAGHPDWRLPNTKELQSIVDYGRHHPAIDNTFFPGSRGENYWSSTTNSNRPEQAFIVGFGIGYVWNKPKSDSYYVRAVRGGR